MSRTRTLRLAPRLRASLALSLAIAPWHTALAADSCAAASNSPEAKTSQLILDALIATNGVPGMGAAVWRDGEVVWTGCSGLRDIAAKLPVERDTVFRLASVSKPLAITAAAKLAEQGRLDLDAPVSGMLPWLRNDWQPISVRQLSAHISGMPHYQLGDRNAGQRHYATGRDAVGIFSERKLLSVPGTTYRYSSWGYTLIGAVIEARSGRHYLDYLAEQITPGLAIQADTDGLGKNVSRLYKIGDGAPRPAPPNDFSYTWPGGGMAGTPEALARFGGRLLQGRIVSPKTWQAMLQPTLYANGLPVRERDYGLGLGWRIGRDEDGAGIAHHAGTTDGARSALVLWPQQGLAASVLSNAQWVSAIDKTAMMLAAPHRPRPQGLVPRPCPLAATRYRGSLGERRFDGELSFRLVDGRCIGQLSAANSLGSYFDAAEAWPDRKLQVIALDRDGQLTRAALVAPTGLYDLRAAAAGGWSARFSDELSLELRL
ncbi:beta-lactamase family protein [Lysobacter antibioticus]|uniref:serine hydrolase domain-containing protein n=1 Tax=Lysobacter antibioticus TaxID=84531 RepID=UPI0007171236|nr:serine hydrolase domain-containing protein [Lysobacter antibioticus]ALN61922.1 beta-lactamase family protein [Lysobacter antibioticus]